MKRTHINPFKNADGSRNVSFYEGPMEGWVPAGRLMPEVKNHVKEQPTNRWKQRLIDAQRQEATANA